MKERPILFSCEMVRALLSGAKTQTRRVMRPQPDDPENTFCWRSEDGFWIPWPKACTDGLGFRCPYGKPGDRLWVRETWAPICGGHTIASYALAPDADEARGAVFRADGRIKSDGVMSPATTTIENGFVEDEANIRWRPSVHMPRWASRITLEITDVRVERVQDIRTDDIASEGVRLPRRGFGDPVAEFIDRTEREAREAFVDLWDSINAKRGFAWADNPYVWVVTFKRVAP